MAFVDDEAWLLALFPGRVTYVVFIEEIRQVMLTTDAAYLPVEGFFQFHSKLYRHEFLIKVGDDHLLVVVGSWREWVQMLVDEPSDHLWREGWFTQLISPFKLLSYPDSNSIAVVFVERVFKVSSQLPACFFASVNTRTWRVFLVAFALAFEPI